jgi:hypothetical protein
MYSLQSLTQFFKHLHCGWYVEFETGRDTKFILNVAVCNSCCFLQGGSVPHLTYEVLQMVTKEQHLLHIPISTVAQCYEAVSASQKSIADFIGLKVAAL